MRIFDLLGASKQCVLGDECEYAPYFGGQECRCTRLEGTVWLCGPRQVLFAQDPSFSIPGDAILGYHGALSSTGKNSRERGPSDSSKGFAPAARNPDLPGHNDALHIRLQHDVEETQRHK